MTWKRAPRAPFPWQVERRGPGHYTVVDARRVGVIGPNQVAQSNAWLIASAPDLLLACKSAMTLLEDMDATGYEAYGLLRAALNRAEIIDDPADTDDVRGQ